VRTRQHPPFFKTLFDLSFTRFLTPRLIPLAYVLGLIVVLAYALAISTAVGANTSPGGQGISWFASAIAFIFVFVLGAIFVRIQIEVTAVAFRIYERVVPPAEGPVD
jgi:Domain of unknown function (DUF4282)